MIEIEIADTHWYGVSRIFPTPEEARAAYVGVNEYDSTGRLDIGVYRHQRVGLDDGPVLVSIVGMRREGVEEAERLIGGKEIEQHPDTWAALIARRVRVVMDLHAKGERSGHYEMPHGEEGETMTPDGRFP